MSRESVSDRPEEAVVQSDVTIILTARLPNGDIVNICSYFDKPDTSPLTLDVVLMHLHSAVPKLGYYMEQKWREQVGT